MSIEAWLILILRAIAILLSLFFIASVAHNWIKYGPPAFWLTLWRGLVNVGNLGVQWFPPASWMQHASVVLCFGALAAELIESWRLRRQWKKRIAEFDKRMAALRENIANTDNTE